MKNQNSKLVRWAAIFICLTSACHGQIDCPNSNDISSAATSAKNIYIDFLTQTLPARLSISYNDSMPEKYKNILKDSTKNTIEKLDALLLQQQQYKKTIEDYPADDWEGRFGETGLWNKIKADILKTEKLIKKTENCTIETSDFEKNAAAAILEIKNGNDKLLKKTINQWPQSKSIFGEIIVEKLIRTKNFSATQTEIILACDWIIENNPSDYTKILLDLIEIEKFKLPIVFYTAALAVEKNDPQRAIDLFSKTEKEDAKKRAVKLAYDLYKQKKYSCQKTITAFENYFQDTISDYNIACCYAAVLADCGKEITAESTNQKFEYIINKTAKNNNSGLTDTLVKAYAEFLISQNAMPQALAELTKVKTLTNKDINFYLPILSNIIINLDESAETEGKKFIANCINLAEKLKAESIPTAELWLTELQIFQAETITKKLESDIEKISRQNDKENFELLRIMARLETKKQNFESAYALWSKILAKTNDSGFWTAKYYQLFCLAQMGSQNRQKSIHAAEILLNSRQIPEFWQKKLLNLTQLTP